MDPLDFMTEEDMVNFFRRKKTQISCIKEPQTFLDQLRDHDLVPEDLYLKVIRKKNKKNMREGVYEILDWVEKNRRQRMKQFWSCVFEYHMLQEYPALLSLQKSLLNEKINMNKEFGREETKQAQKKSATKRKKNAKETDQEEPGPSSVSSQKKVAKKPLICRPVSQQQIETLKRKRKLRVICGGKKGVLHKAKFKKRCPVPQQTAESLKRKRKLPVKRRGCPVPQQQIETLKRKRKLRVTCGGKKGFLHKAKFKKREPCILFEDKWLTLSKFEKIGGKERNKNGKISIFHKKFNLQTLIKNGILPSPPRKIKRSKKKRVLKRIGRQ